MAAGRASRTTWAAGARSAVGHPYRGRAIVDNPWTRLRRRRSAPRVGLERRQLELRAARVRRIHLLLVENGFRRVAVLSVVGSRTVAIGNTKIHRLLGGTAVATRGAALEAGGEVGGTGQHHIHRAIGVAVDANETVVSGPPARDAGP